MPRAYVRTSENTAFSAGIGTWIIILTVGWPFILIAKIIQAIAMGLGNKVEDHYSEQPDILEEEPQMVDMRRMSSKYVEGDR